MMKQNHIELLPSQTLYTQKNIISMVSNSFFFFFFKSDFLVLEGGQPVENVSFSWTHMLNHFHDLTRRPYL